MPINCWPSTGAYPRPSELFRAIYHYCPPTWAKGCLERVRRGICESTRKSYLKGELFLYQISICQIGIVFIPTGLCPLYYWSLSPEAYPLLLLFKYYYLSIISGIISGGTAGSPFCYSKQFHNPLTYKEIPGRWTMISDRRFLPIWCLPRNELTNLRG